MRQLIPVWVVLLSCGLAMSQGDWTPLGNYAQPFVSRISTPSAAPGSIPPPFLSLKSPSLTAGATNATAGNVAGAATSTLSIVSSGSGVQFNQPLWYGPGVKFDPQAAYAEPFVSRISTPSAAPGSIPPPFLSLESPSLTAGATNATAGNVAGAATSTLSIVSSGSGMQFNPEAYGSSPSQVQVQAGPSREGREFELGAATFQSNYAVAQLAAISGAQGKGRRVYTNSDIAQVNDSNRSIQYTGKMEGVN